MVSKEKILDSLYSNCQNRSLSTKEVTTKMMKDLGIVLNDQQIKDLQDAIRPYKNSGAGLEKTIHVVECIINSNTFGHGNYCYSQPTSLDAADLTWNKIELNSMDNSDLQSITDKIFDNFWKTFLTLPNN